MIEITKIAQRLEDGLNDLAPVGTVSFNLRANTGTIEQKPENELRSKKKKLQHTEIDGAMSAITSQVTPLINLNNYNINTAVNFAIPAPIGEIEDKSIATLVYNILVEYIEENNGVAYNMEFKANTDPTDTTTELYAVIPIFEMPQISELTKIAGLGFGYNVSLYINYSFVKSGVLSNEIHISIDNEELVIIGAGIARTKVLATDNRENDIEMRSETAQQGVLISATVPYRNTTLCTSLITEIIKPTALKINRTLKYWDGVAFTAESPFSDTVTLQSGKLNIEVGKIAGIIVEFLLAIPIGG